MNRCFNITGCCNPQEHYMVNLDHRLAQIKEMVDKGQYFCINHGQQYGKTTILKALQAYLKEEYAVIRIDFQFISTSEFATESVFVKALARLLWSCYRREMPGEIEEQVKQIKQSLNHTEVDLFTVLSRWCAVSSKPIVLMVDEADHPGNSQTFLDFLAQLRGRFLARNKRPTFRSVILSSVHDVRNLRPPTEDRYGIPWNIASAFEIDMSFNAHDIAGMLTEYENDHHTGMDIQKLSQLIYDYTSGYPVLVSMICKYMDEKFGWQTEGVSDAVKLILTEHNPLFETLIYTFESSQNLYDYLYQILILGKRFLYTPDNSITRLAMTYDFLKEENGSVAVANRIFEMRLYNAILTSNEMQETPIYKASEWDKNQFIQGD